jgi:hypothetical protein
MRQDPKYRLDSEKYIAKLRCEISRLEFDIERRLALNTLYTVKSYYLSKRSISLLHHMILCINKFPITFLNFIVAISNSINIK